MKKYVIIVAGGKGLRVGGDIPKQFRLIGELPVLMHTLNTFNRYDPDIECILVLPSSHQEYWTSLCKKYSFNTPHILAEGGETRFHSVKNGLAHITAEGLVAVHDGVRPFVSQKVIAESFVMAVKYGAVIPVIEMTDSLRETEPDGSSHSVLRSRFKAVQTPQVFQSEIIISAYSQPYKKTFTDDASVVETSGFSVTMINGNIENIKITTPQDLLLAELLLQNV